ncbi:c-type cytochrome [Aliiruegeria lutimaris]|uniref:Cytochrome c556 n=1 Tax=Aliiruegeria lutimaris TaxID=571298 RepID=A0A1G9H9F1_9RHOB|nr:cytochrome c [Aliiruegeria lutimaris]SDL09507.1 Cytochrome c556 [Aliiruegeria lutimaris]
MRKIILIATAIALSVPSIAAADAATDAVKARQEHMKSYGKQMATFAAMAKGEVEYDAAAAQAAAETLAELIKADQSGFWLPGTSADDMPGVSYASADLWNEFDKAGAIGGELAAAVATMQEVAGNGKGEMAQALGGIGKNCQACHKAYQLKKD